RSVALFGLSARIRARRHLRGLSPSLRDRGIRTNVTVRRHDCVVSSTSTHRRDAAPRASQVPGSPLRGKSAAVGVLLRRRRGEIVGVNGEFDADCASVADALFLEVIAAPSFSADALSILSRKKNLRLVTIAPPETGTELRSAAGGVLVQSVDKISPPANWKVV